MIISEVVLFNCDKLLPPPLMFWPQEPGAGLVGMKMAEQPPAL